MNNIDKQNLNIPKDLVWTDELVAKFWDGAEQVGIISSNSFGKMARKSIYWLIANKLTLSGRHLDYGSGGGDVALYLMDKGYPFSVYEPSLDRKKDTKSLISQHPEYLGEPAKKGSESYDVVTCFEVLEHVLSSHFENVCDDLAGHVRKDGFLVVSTPNNEDLRSNMVYCPISNTAFHRWQHVRSVTPAFLESQFTVRGFETICMHQLDFSESLFAPYLHYMGIIDNVFYEEELSKYKNDNMPKHIYEILNNINSVMGAASNILYIGKKK